MSSRNLAVFAIIAAMLCAPLLIGLPVSAQNGQARRGQTSPATGHAQVIAQGVAAIPQPEFGWQVVAKRVAGVTRIALSDGEGGFILAARGSLAVAADDGTVLARLAGGEATWIAPGQSLVVIGLERRAVDYFEITFRPVANLAAESGNTVTEGPFPAPAGEAFDVDLIRDALLRAEEVSIPAGAGPSLLVVMSGTVFVTAGSGEVVALEAGGVLTFTGQVDVTGASRALATFVVARIGQEVAPLVAPRGDTPMPAATPVASPVATTTSITITALLCPDAYSGGDFVADCVTPAEGTAFSLESRGTTLLSFLADAAGQLTFSDIEPGRYTLLAGLRDPSAYSRVTCLDPAGAAAGAETARNLASLAVDAGEAVQCRWYIVPNNATADSTAASLSVAIKACPAGMTAKTLVADLCEPAPPGVSLSLFAGETPLGVTTVGAALWSWSGLAPRAYDLVINVIPPPFDTVLLDETHCCNDRGGFTVIPDPGLTNDERQLFLLQPATAFGAAEIDSDDDGLSDPRETEIGTNPFRVDTDDDGLSDFDESELYGTDPLLADTDGDGLDDGIEIGELGTNPFLVDTDGDGVADDAT